MPKHALLLMTLLLLCALLPGCPLEELPPDGQNGGSTGAAVATIEQRAFDLVNIERANHGLPALVMDSAIRGVARRHSQEMAAYNYFNHTNLAGMSPADRLNNAGIPWRVAGENIAYNSGHADPAAAAVVSWMNSPGHRANILNADYTHTGMGVARQENGLHFFTQVFVGR